MAPRSQDGNSPYDDMGGHGMGAGMQFAMPSLTPMVKLLILVNGVIFGFSFLLSFSPGTWLGFREVFGISPWLWKDYFPLLPLWQLFTYGFLHDTNNLFHVVGNMLFLYFLGTMLEGLIGGRRFLVTYLSAVLVAGLAMLVTGLLLGTERVTLGASGAVLAIVVAMAVLRPDTRIIFLIFPITLKTFALIYVGFDVFGVLQELKGVDSNVAYPAHLTGALFGFLSAKRGWLWRDPVQGVERWREEREQKQEVFDAQRLDDILAKIHSQGINSLSSGEKAFLKRKSKAD